MRVSHRRLAASFLTAPLLVGALLAFTPAPAAATGGESLVSVINGYRSNANLGPVALHSVVDQIATERSNEIAAARQIGHDFEALKARLAQLGVCWERLGEIVLYNSRLDVAAFGRQWYNSPAHNAIMLGHTFTHAGGSYTTGSDGYHYAVMIFVKLCGQAPAPPAPAAPTGQFSDTAGSMFSADIAWIVDAGITNGCGSGVFCPVAAVPREQMASFLKRALGLPSTGGDYFTDDDASGHHEDINRVAAAGVANGCGSGQFCPGNVVSRDQMASFLARSLGLPGTSSDYFWDDDGNIHEDAINRLAAAGVVSGCGDGRYCPAASVTREQMAAFLHRAFD